MNVVFVLSSTDRYAGSTRAFMSLLRGVISKGIKVIVVVPDKSGIYEDLQEIGVEVIALLYRPNTWTYRRNFSEKLLFIPRQIARLYVNRRAISILKQLLQSREISIIHTNVSVINIGAKVAEHLSIPHIYHFREYGDLIDIIYYPSNKAFYNSIKKLKTYSICITKDIQKHYKLDNNSRSCVVYDGVINNPESLKNNKSGNYFLYAGRIEPIKGLLLLLQSYLFYSKTVESPLKLKVAGRSIDSVYYEQVLNFISNNQIEDKVNLLGEVDDVTSLYSNARALIVPSTFEGFGLCMPEAMALGCIVVGRNTGGTKEQFDNGVEFTGEEIGYRYNTEKELSDILLHLHSISVEEYIHKSTIAFQTVKSLYTTENNVNNIISFYDHIINNANK